jgi:hypothetical protein
MSKPSKVKSADIMSGQAVRLADLTAEIQIEHEAVIGSFKSGFDHAVRCGELLIKAKKIVDHGCWLPWLKANPWISSRTASDYMRLAANRSVIEAKSAESADLTIQSALRLLAPPKSEPIIPTPSSTLPVPPSEKRITAAKQALHDCEPAERKAVWRSPGLMESIVDATPTAGQTEVAEPKLDEQVKNDDDEFGGMTDAQLSAERALLLGAMLPSLRAVLQPALRLHEVESEILWRRDQKHGPTNELAEIKKRRGAGDAGLHRDG